MSEAFVVKSSIRDYQVRFSHDIESTLMEVLRGGDVVIMDERVSKDHPHVRSAVTRGIRIVEIHAHETTKSYEGVIPIIDTLISIGFRRNNRLIAIGGGITQDVTAFIASILYRGVDWIFIPTTLLAQGDSCIGSKTSINFRESKNQLGNFYPPLEIHIDSTFLKTLDNRDIRSGVGEMAHYFFVSGDEDVVWFEREFEESLTRRTNLHRMIQKSLSIKKSYVERDEFDKGERIVFNYGHTFGHAIESITDYAIPHGVAVSFGMDMANFISVQKGYIPYSDFERAHRVFSVIWEGYDIRNLDLADMLKAMMKDKKNQDGKLGLILSKGWGAMFPDLTPPDEMFVGWMRTYFKNYHLNTIAS
jgi:3-dehydroquinate synthase